mmetsp:Transcript_44183/g.112773  ORF Transcript_44183/g.112773 Transcript_44183/m.112773 type:complete len:225 (+) Transcript_44183:166-840(+)
MSLMKRFSSSSPLSNLRLALPWRWPSACAAFMTSSAMLALISRMFLRPGYTRPSWRSHVDSWCGIASAAAMSMASDTTCVCPSCAPSASPGKRYMLLDCDDATMRPLYSTSSKGDPEAKMARPLVALMAASAVHSMLEVGLLMGKMRGRMPLGWLSAMVAIISGVNRSRTVERPTSRLGLVRATVSASCSPSYSPSGRTMPSPSTAGSMSSPRPLVTRPLWSST